MSSVYVYPHTGYEYAVGGGTFNTPDTQPLVESTTDKCVRLETALKNQDERIVELERRVDILLEALKALDAQQQKYSVPRKNYWQET